MASCALCLFGAAAWAGPPTFAFVLGLGPDVGMQRAAADAWAAGHVETGATAFCAACRRVSWLARRDCAQEALLEHVLLRRRIAALHRHQAPSVDE